MFCCSSLRRVPWAEVKPLPGKVFVVLGDLKTTTTTIPLSGGEAAALCKGTHVGGKKTSGLSVATIEERINGGAISEMLLIRRNAEQLGGSSACSGNVARAL